MQKKISIAIFVSALDLRGESMSKFKKGQTVWIALSGAGTISYEEREIGTIRKNGVWLDNGIGNDPTGPFNPETGRYLGDTVFGFSMKILTEKPK